VIRGYMIFFKPFVKEDLKNIVVKQNFGALFEGALSY